MVEAIKSGKYPFVMCNFAPPDMVGHTGVYEAAVIACAATGSNRLLYLSMKAWSIHFCSVSLPLDKSIGDIQRACEECGYVMLVTADHGNAERMIDEDGKPVTKHTTFRGMALWRPFTHPCITAGWCLHATTRWHLSVWRLYNMKK